MSRGILGTKLFEEPFFARTQVENAVRDGLGVVGESVQGLD